MRRTDRWRVWGLAVAAAGLAVAACARDAAEPRPGLPTATGTPAAALTDGAVVRAQVLDVVEVPRTGAAAAVRVLGSGPREGVVAGGAALDAANGTLLAVGPARVGRQRDLRHGDDQGHEHRLALDGTSEGEGPPASVRYERDGEVVAEVDYRWERQGGGYVLRERTLTLHGRGRILLRQVRRLDGVAIAAGAAAADVGSGGASAPPPVQRAQAIPCLREWAVYIGASTAMILAGEVFTIMPNPATGSALVASIAAWETALDKLLVCQVNSVLPF